jgi:hypothetical protein
VKFNLNDTVRISVSGEEGQVVARSESVGATLYLIRYKAADGRAVEMWWDESALELSVFNQEGEVK